MTASATFTAMYDRIVCRVDRFFAFLMVLQWLFGIFLAIVVSPRAWSGAESTVHTHVWAAVVLGGVLNLLPATLAIVYPGRVITRQVIAVSQMLAGALLIHLTGGRIETHFHVFGSLAFLAFYRDWRVLVTASLVVVVDHFLRGLYWPESIYAIAVTEKWRWLEHTGWVIFEDVFLIYGCVIGISDLKAIASRQESLSGASDSKSLFLANMSHEIRTPLGAILGFSELLKDPTLGKEDRHAYLDVISRNGHVLTRLIDDILDLSKVEAGQLEVEKVSFSLSGLLDDIAHSLAVKAREKAVELRIERSAEFDVIQSDPTRLRQILLNVIGNAIKFTPRGWVRVSVHGTVVNEAIHLTFIVQDTGVGLSEEQREKLFRPFSQADASTTRRFGGSGLGLILSRNLAKNLGGDLNLVESVQGGGSTFRVDIVAGRVQASVIPVRAGAEVANRPKILQGLHVLVADDAPDNQLLLHRLLTMHGAVVSSVTNGLEATEHALSQNYDAVLMDIQMPVMDGHTATRLLRSKGYTKPIIALTAHAMREERDRCMASGFSHHLIKPIDHRRLVETISQAARILATEDPKPLQRAEMSRSPSLVVFSRLDTPNT